MKSAALCIDESEQQDLKTGFLCTYAKGVLLKQLKNLKHGELILNDGSEQHIFGIQDERMPKAVVITVYDRSLYTSILVSVDLGGRRIIKKKR